MRVIMRIGSKRTHVTSIRPKRHPVHRVELKTQGKKKDKARNPEFALFLQEFILSFKSNLFWAARFCRPQHKG
jgi:hypothetical protein